MHGIEYCEGLCVAYQDIKSVRLAIHPDTGEQAAVKVVNKVFGANSKSNRAAIEKEATIHRSVNHPNIISLYATAEDELAYYLIMEFGSGGELFDKIAPDIGVGENLAHFYYKQLVAGMAHLHEIGISHRDLKPENILLDDYGNLKISDFGLATVFRFKGVVRPLTTPCGSAPYVAPEIYGGSYDGQAVDIWSSGIILYALLAGNTPWGEPMTKDAEFHQYLKCYPNNLLYDPWSRFSGPVHKLLLSILNSDTTKRYNIDQIRRDPWFCKPNSMLSRDGKCNDTAALAEMIRTQMNIDVESRENSDPENYIMSYSQPESQVRRQGFGDLFPSHGITRFYCMLPPIDIFSRLCSTLSEFVVPYKMKQKQHQITFNTVDKRKCPLNGDIRIQAANSDGEVSLVVFRKIKVRFGSKFSLSNYVALQGDPIEFKRYL
ncbi:Chk1 protein kinase [Phlyctochytrium planicorne]|nr:Chk1 protein kinase [Phlyctochytrium planicorne]